MFHTAFLDNMQPALPLINQQVMNTETQPKASLDCQWTVIMPTITITPLSMENGSLQI